MCEKKVVKIIGGVENKSKLENETIANIIFTIFSSFEVKLLEAHFITRLKLNNIIDKFENLDSLETTRLLNSITQYFDKIIELDFIINSEKDLDHLNDLVRFHMDMLTLGNSSSFMIFYGYTDDKDKPAKLSGVNIETIQKFFNIKKESKND